MRRNRGIHRTLARQEQIYPWNQWFGSKKETTIVQGRDYHVSTPIMEQMIRNRACSKKYRLAIRMRINDEKTVIRFSVRGSLDDIPDKTVATAPTRMSTFGRITIGQTFRFVLTSGKVDYLNPVYTKMKMRGIKGNPYNASYTYKARDKWRTRYVFVRDNQRVGVIEKETV